MTEGRRRTERTTRRVGVFRWRVSLVACALLTGVLLVANARLYHSCVHAYGGDALAPDVLPSLRFLGSALDDGAATRMQGRFPEGYLFLWATYGLAWADAGLRDAEGGAVRGEAIAAATRALRAIDSDAGRAPFDAALQPAYGVFYVGWTTWLRGKLVGVTPEGGRQPEEIERFERDCATLAGAFSGSETPFLPAYPGRAWPCDSVVAVACLRLHDTLLEPRYGSVVHAWVAQAKELLDAETGLLPHEVDAETGDVLQGARGSSQSIIQRLLAEVDPQWAEEQYTLFRDQFIASPFTMPGVREHPRGVRRGGDVDSGPLLLGLSPSASVVAVGAALAHGDHALADPVCQSIEALAAPVSRGRTKRYLVGGLPVLDGFLVWSKTAAAPDGVAPAARAPVAPWWWRLPTHVVSLLVVVLMARALVRMARSTRSRARSLEAA